MHIVSAPELQSVVTEVQLEGFWKSHSDADYFWFKQDDRSNQWTPVDSLRTIVGKQRGRGLRKQAAFDISIDEKDKVRSKDNYTISGNVGVSYTLRYPRKLINASKDTLQILQDALHSALLDVLKDYEALTIPSQSAEVVNKINKILEHKLLEEWGLKLLVTRLPVETLRQQIIERGQLDRDQKGQEYLSQQLQDRYETDLVKGKIVDDISILIPLKGEQSRLQIAQEIQTAQLKGDYDLVIARTQYLVQQVLLEGERDKIALEADKVLQLGNASAQVEALHLNNIVNQIKSILPPGVDPLFSVSLLNPAAAEALAKIAEAQGHTQLLTTYLQSKSPQMKVAQNPTKISSTLHPPDNLLASPAKIEPSDPMELALRRHFNDVQECQLISLNPRKYQIKFSDVGMELLLTNQQLSQLKYGPASRPSSDWRKWTGTMIGKDGGEEGIVKIIEIVREHYKHPRSQ